MDRFAHFICCLRQAFLAVLMAVMLMGVVDKAGATESGGGAYPNGVEDFMSAALPPPGTYFMNYLSYYRAASLKDQSGNDAMPKFDLDAVANVFRFVHISKQQIFGASWGMHIFLPLAHVNVDATRGSDNRSGLGDILFSPMVLGWHFKNVHVVAAVDTYVPTGAYDKNRLANIGRNYWTFEPACAVTYLADNGFEASGKFMYDFNLKNTDTDYRSGQEFHFDYAVGFHPNRDWVAGASGYFYYQTTDDEQNGVKVGTDGYRGRVFSIGPTVAYQYKNTSFTLKWQKEFKAENRPEGDHFLLKFIYAF